MEDVELMELHVLVVNVNNLQMTKSLVEDLQQQTLPCYLTIVDQGSVEPGTMEYLQTILGAKVIYNDHNVPLNWMWNYFYQNTTEPYLCFLNNDTRITCNFVEDIVEIFNRESNVGCVVHAVNHPEYVKRTLLHYVIPDGRFVQGWDFTLRRECYTLIPEELKFFGGDDWLYHNLYEKGWKVAVALSSPILHYKAVSRRYVDRQVLNQDSRNFKMKGYKRLPYGSSYTRKYPTKEIQQAFEGSYGEDIKNGRLQM
jgi:hypothetical protein